jgi:hypothetical protein
MMPAPPKRPRTPRTPQETLRAIAENAAADEMDRIVALSPAELDAELAAAGFDPDEVGAQGVADAEALLARREEQAWQAAAQEKLARVQAAFAAKAARPREKLPRAELLARIGRARVDPRLTQPVAVMFRNKRTEEASDEELEELLTELEALAEHEPE